MEPNFSKLSTSETSDTKNLEPDDFDVDNSHNDLTSEELVKKQSGSDLTSIPFSRYSEVLKLSRSDFLKHHSNQFAAQPKALLMLLIFITITLFGVITNNWLLGILATLVTLILSLAMLIPWLMSMVDKWLSPQDRTILTAFLGIIVAIIGLLKFTGTYRYLTNISKNVNWDATGNLGDWFGALGQILIAIIAVYVAWRQYVISKDLTIQQNLLTMQQNIITQQQTIDSYFQGISDLVLDDEGLLEDWPQERAIAEGRTAAIFSSVDGSGKAKILRFLSRSKLLSPLQRDRRLGRAILNGSGGYAEDRLEGIRVIDLGVMLAAADLSGNDLRWTDLSEANFVRANLSDCDLVKANLSRTILYDANLKGADFNGIRLFYGSGEKASPRSRTQPPNYETGEYTGAVVENANFTNVQRMSDAVREYCCAWGGEKTRSTIPGGCEGIPNKLETH